MKHLAIHVSGKVQGVFFRASAKGKADELNITGVVRNEKDGSVYIEAEGKDENLKQFVAWCHQGPAKAEVARVVVNEGTIRHFKTFEIKRW
ncbi:MAG: acylphosphatase [Cyclobacteriaceae bacterium]